MTKILSRPIFVLMLTLALLISGWKALNNLEISLLPDIEYPEFYIVTELPGAAPDEIEKSITIPLEEAISSLPNLLDVISYSREGISVVKAQFNWNIDFRFTLLRIREKIDAILYRFPEDAEKPFILDFNPGSIPVMELVMKGNDDLTYLTEFAEDVLKPRFSQLPGIASAEITGAVPQSIQILLLPEKLLQYGIQPREVQASIKDNLPGYLPSSTVMTGYAEYPLTLAVRLDSYKDFLQMPIRNSRGIPIKLGDIARIKKAPLPERSCTFLDSTRVLGINLYRESGANAVKAAENALHLIREIEHEYPGIELKVIKNRGKIVRQSVSGLQQAIVSGAFLAFMIILFFLKEIKQAFILILAIPVSLFFSFIALYLHDISLNLMTLGGLALGIGLIVDNGIVVTESISTELQNRLRTESIVTGTGKVARAIIGSTLTTIAIFIPVIYVKGYAAALFKYQALSIVYTLLVSILSALLLIPTAINALVVRKSRNENAAHKFNIYDEFQYKTGFLLHSGFKFIRFLISVIKSLIKILTISWRVISKPLFKGFDTIYHLLYKYYHKILIRALDHKYLTLLAGLILLFIGYLAYHELPKQYMPETSVYLVEAEILTPSYFPFEIVKKEMLRINSKLREDPDVRSVLLHLSDPSVVQSGYLSGLVQNPGYYKTQLSIFLNTPLKEVSGLENTLLALIRFPDTHLAVKKVGFLGEEFFSTEKKNLVIYLSGEDERELKKAAGNLQNFVRDMEQCRNVSLEMGGRMTVHSITLNSKARNLFGFSGESIADLLKQQTSGVIIGNWLEGNRKIPVSLFWETPQDKNLDDLLELPLALNKAPLKVGDVIDLKTENQPDQIVRVNRKRVISVQADVNPRELGPAVNKVTTWISNNKYPGIEVSISGESRRIAQAFREMQNAFMLAVVIVYLILAAQFESLLHPFNIILTVPMGLIGAFLSLFIFGESINVISLIGMIMLIGIGVNDAIIKVDYMNRLRKRENRSLREAILITSREKFRPVLMTTLTTIFAMLPMLVGFGGNSEMNKPLAMTIIGGLAFTTMLTLIFTPLIYEIFEKVKQRIRTIINS